jgi:hypothetical protein
VERVERLLLELAHAFGTNAEVGAEAAQRLHRPVEAIAAAQDRLLRDRLAIRGRRLVSASRPAARSYASSATGSGSRSPNVSPRAPSSPLLGSSSEHGTRSTAIRLSTCARSMPVSRASSPQDGSRPCTRT